MGVAGGPKIETDGLVFAIDSDSNVRGYTKYGTSGTNNNHRAIRNLVDRSSTYSMADTSHLTGGVTYYTLYGITYPEGNYSPANRDGITPGFENISATKTYYASRDVNYYVFDEDTNTWVADSYFNGERINGHCYDTYDGQPSQHAAFQADYDNIKSTFPNATHIIIGSHASENVDNDADTVTRLKEIGFPDDAVGLGRVEFILVGKVGKPWTHHYVRENVSSAVANMVIGLPLEGKGGALTFDGTDDYIALPSSFRNYFTSAPVSVELVLIKSSADQGNMVVFDVDVTRWNLNYNLYRSGEWSFDFYDGTEHIISAGNYDDEYVHFVLQQLSNGTMEIYANGVLKGTITSSGNLSPNSSGPRIGSRTNGAYYFKGELPVFKIYDRALSADEVQQNYNAYKNRFNL